MSEHRVVLGSMTDVRKEHRKVYKEFRNGHLSASDFAIASQGLNRHNGMIVSELELDIAKELAEMNERLVSAEEKRA